MKCMFSGLSTISQRIFIFLFFYLAMCKEGCGWLGCHKMFEIFVASILLQDGSEMCRKHTTHTDGLPVSFLDGHFPSGSCCSGHSIRAALLIYLQVGRWKRSRYCFDNTLAQCQLATHSADFTMYWFLACVVHSIVWSELCCKVVRQPHAWLCVFFLFVFFNVHTKL